MQTRSSDENYVCLSACQTRELWQTREKSYKFLYHTNDHFSL